MYSFFEIHPPPPPQQTHILLKCSNLCLDFSLFFFCIYWALLSLSPVLLTSPWPVLTWFNLCRMCFVVFVPWGLQNLLLLFIPACLRGKYGHCCSLRLSHYSLSVCVLYPEVTLALLDVANDKDGVVQEQVRKSMLTLGKQQPDRVLSMCQDYLLKHPKVGTWRSCLALVIPLTSYGVKLCVWQNDLLVSISQGH